MRHISLPKLIATTSHCTLSTMGPAGVQASIVACIVRDDCVYALVPSTGDHLFNLEYDTELVLTTALWQLRGAALVIGGADGLHGTAPHDVSTRTKAGLAAARARGKYGGRPRVLVPKMIAQLQALAGDRTNTIADILDTLKISRTTYYRYR